VEGGGIAVPVWHITLIRKRRIKNRLNAKIRQSATLHNEISMLYYKVLYRQKQERGIGNRTEQVQDLSPRERETVK
jgi:hypothetical protein